MKNICQLFGTTPSTCSRNFRQEQIQMAYIVEQGKKYKIPNFNNINIITLGLVHVVLVVSYVMLQMVVLYGQDIISQVLGTIQMLFVILNEKYMILGIMQMIMEFLADSAFPTRGPLFKKIITSLKRGDIIVLMNSFFFPPKIETIA